MHISNHKLKIPSRYTATVFSALSMPALVAQKFITKFLQAFHNLKWKFQLWTIPIEECNSVRRISILLDAYKSKKVPTWARTLLVGVWNESLLGNWHIWIFQWILIWVASRVSAAISKCSICIESNVSVQEVLDTLKKIHESWNSVHQWIDYVVLYIKVQVIQNGCPFIPALFALFNDSCSSYIIAYWHV